MRVTVYIYLSISGLTILGGEDMHSKESRIKNEIKLRVKFLTTRNGMGEGI